MDSKQYSPRPSAANKMICNIDSRKLYAVTRSDRLVPIQQASLMERYYAKIVALKSEQNVDSRQALKLKKKNPNCSKSREEEEHIIFNVQWIQNQNWRILQKESKTAVIKRGWPIESIRSKDGMPYIGYYEFCFKIEQMAEPMKPWMGIGIVTAKNQEICNGGVPSWLGKDKCSIGWFSGTNMWHNNTTKRYCAPSHSFQNGDIINMIINCRKSTLNFNINGENMGVAAYHLDELLNLQRGEIFYIIISMQRDRNEISVFPVYQKYYKKDV